MSFFSPRSIRMLFLMVIVFTVVNVSFIRQQFESKFRQHGCDRSMSESDQYICETDEKWEQRRKFYTEQHEKNIMTMNEYEDYFKKNWFPEFQCEREIRLGEEDGGKWACDIEYLKTKESCLIYSLGSGRDFRFEVAAHKHLPHCSIHTIDMQFTFCPDKVCTFHHVQLGDGQNGTKTLRQFMNEVNHTSGVIDILKIDIEYSEYVFFHTLFSNNEINRSSSPVYIRQILLEVHLDRTRLFETNALFYLLHAQNYVIYHRELNRSFPHFACEYGFLKLNKSFFHDHC